MELWLWRSATGEYRKHEPFLFTFFSALSCSQEKIRSYIRTIACCFMLVRNNTHTWSDMMNVIQCNTDACFQYFLAISLANVTEDCTHCFSSLGSDDEPVTERHCHCINQQVGRKWKDVLRYLRTEEVTIDALDEDYSKVAEKFYQGLLAWMRSRGTQRATTKKLCEALHRAGCSEALNKLSREGMSSYC